MPLNPRKLPDNSSPLILGHRGASTIAPENTLAAFTRAMSDGADGIEFDVRLSRDGVPVVIHDANLRRTASRDQLVSSLSAAELRQINVGHWFDPKFDETLPTLADVFQLFTETPGLLNVEMKCEPGDVNALARAVVETIRQFAFEDRVIVSSFDLNAIVAVKEFDPAARTAALFEPTVWCPIILRLGKLIRAALAAKADQIALHHTLVTRSLLERFRSAGFEVIVWTVDDPVWIGRARNFQIKALICNDPGTMIKARDLSVRSALEDPEKQEAVLPARPR